MTLFHLLLLVAQTYPSPGPKNATTAASLTSWVTAITPGTTRHDFPGAAGVQFTTAGAAIPMKAAGRYCVSGNSQTHTIWVTDAGATTVLGSTTVNMSGCTAASTVYGSLVLTLAANTVYNILSSEITDGDDFLQNDESLITTTSVIINTGSPGSNFLAAFSGAPPSGISTTSGAGKMYVGISIQY